MERGVQTHSSYCVTWCASMPNLLFWADIPTANQQLSLIVGSGLGLITIVQIVFGFRNDRRDTAERVAREQRETRQAQAKAGYELVDALFDDDPGGTLLENLDAGLENSPNLTRRHGDAIQTADTFARAFSTEENAISADLIAIRIKFDAVLYYLDRFEHAIKARITTFEDVRASFYYYSKLLSSFAPAIDRYAQQIGYERASEFLKRYPNWHKALT
jgi:hypothetical protein